MDDRVIRRLGASAGAFRTARHPVSPAEHRRDWLACHRLSLNLEDLAGQEQDENTIILPNPSPPWPTPRMPRDRLAYQEWLLTDAPIFHCESFPDSPIFSLQAPAVKGLVIYAVRCGTVKFYAAWVESTGTFIGWLKVHPAVEGIDSDYGIGEVLGKPLFLGISLDLNGHMAVDRFVQRLNDGYRIY